MSVNGDEIPKYLYNFVYILDISVGNTTCTYTCIANFKLIAEVHYTFSSYKFSFCAKCVFDSSNANTEIVSRRFFQKIGKLTIQSYH